MKSFIFFFVVLLSCREINAQTIADGYYVTLNGDTVGTRIKVPKDLFANIEIESLEKKAKITDSSASNFRKLRADEIKGYGFNYKDNDFNFVAKPLKPNRLRFFKQLTDGKNVGCFYYYETGYKGAKYETVFVTRANKEDLVLKGRMSRKKIKNKLITFFEDRKDIQDFIQTQSIHKRYLQRSMKEVSESINKL